MFVVLNYSTMGFCSAQCFWESFSSGPSQPQAPEASGDRDLLHALGYRHAPEDDPRETRDAPGRE